MVVVHLSYAHINEYADPAAWLKKLSFYTGILEAMKNYASLKSVHCISYRGIVRQNNVEYHFLKQKKWQRWFPVQLNAYVKRLIPDVVVVHGLIFPWQVILLRLQLGENVKIIAQHHAEKPFRDIRKYLQQWADRYIRAYLFCSIEQGQAWVKKRQINNVAKVKEVMGTSSPFCPIDRTVARAATKVNGETIFLWVGRLDHNKDPLTVIRAFSQFANANSSVRLYMIYQTFERSEEIQDALASINGAATFIHLIGKVPNNDLLYWYNSADFIISSSHYEGSGVAVCEGLSCGCIPILTNIPSFRMMTDNGRIGLLYEVANENALFNCLEKSLTLDREKMTREVLEHFNSTLSYEANARSIVQVIHSL
jgi:glycosyltransferase involved in cell wall biosynthesis